MIATCRVVLAGYAVIALGTGRGIAVVVYALALLAIAWNLRAPSRRFLITVHLLDFALYTAMVLLTHGAAGPVVVFSLFVVFGAMLRFGTAAVIVSGIAAALVAVIFADPGDLLLRVSTVGVITTLVSYISAHQERTLRDMKQLAGWAAGVATGPESMHEVLTRAAALLHAPRAMVVWEGGEEPWLQLAMLDGETFSIAQEGPEAADAVVAADLIDASFFTVTNDDVVVVDDANATRRRRGQPLGDVVRGRVSPRSILSAPLGGEFVRGRFFAFDAPEPTIDDLVLTRVAAGLIAARLAQIHFIDRLRDAAVADERMRLARNLHDWLLQSLTGASLQIEVARRALGAGHPADDRLVKIQELLEADQRELRVFISQLRPARGNAGATPALHSRLASLAERFARQWHVGVDVAVKPAVPVLPEGLAGEVYGLVSEAVANAAKHAAAAMIVTRVEIDDEDIVMSIDDDGRGFPFVGIFTLEELNEQKRGPVTLKERVASLGGSLVLYSTEEGARIEIRIPRH